MNSNHNIDAHACFCVGPQKGQPLCPCEMRGVIQKNGRWVKPEQDLGPVYPLVEPPDVEKKYCYKCGIPLEGVMGYVCYEKNCPTFLNISC